jgi:4-amino-4-deoxy-L-arabinose transferase-like glycosyltransferase
MPPQDRPGTGALAAATVLCLAPFAGKAFHIDEPLFVWTARQIVAEPLDPYGFTVNWSLAEQPMWEVTKNPPLVSYLIAAAGSVVGWSEVALRLVFLLPALAVVLGTHRLARRLTRRPVLAALAALVSPAFLVSSSTVMCDTTMLAFWVWSVVLWDEGLERGSSRRLFAAAVLAALAAVTKYFGMSLIPLLLAHGLHRRRRLGTWALHLVVPLVLLAGYQLWTHGLYGRGLLLDAASYAVDWRTRHSRPVFDRGLVGLVFTGGCFLPALFLAWPSWSRRALAAWGVVALAAALTGHARLFPGFAGTREGVEIAVQFGLYAACGLAVLALAAVELWLRRDACSILLGAWVAGTFGFASFVNWTVNGRSVLPMVPAAAILLARRVDAAVPEDGRRRAGAVVVLLGAAAFVGLWVACGDLRLADAQRSAATLIRDRARGGGVRAVWFQGHWGFHYYMELAGARSMAVGRVTAQEGDLVVLPWNNTAVVGIDRRAVRTSETVESGSPSWVTPMRKDRAAGFYSMGFGPLPFSFGPIPAERYELLVLGAPPAPVSVRQDVP